MMVKQSRAQPHSTLSLNSPRDSQEYARVCTFKTLKTSSASPPPQCFSCSILFPPPTPSSAHQKEKRKKREIQLTFGASTSKDLAAFHFACISFSIVRRPSRLAVFGGPAAGAGASAGVVMSSLFCFSHVLRTLELLLENHLY